MSCASCVGWVEKALRGVPGVVGVNVNLATEVATVEYLGGVAQTSDFERAVGEAGYGVVRAEEEAPEDFREREYGRLWGNFVVAAVLTIFILAGSLAPMLGFECPIPMIWLNFGLLNPVLAAAAMALSSVTVVSNALRLKRTKIV